MKGVLEGNNSSSVKIGAGMSDFPPIQAETTGETINLEEVSINTNRGMVADGSTALNGAGSVAEASIAEEEDNNNLAGTMTPSQPVTTHEKLSTRQRNLKKNSRS